MEHCQDQEQGLPYIFFFFFFSLTVTENPLGRLLGIGPLLMRTDQSPGQRAGKAQLVPWRHPESIPLLTAFD